MAPSRNDTEVQEHAELQELRRLCVRRNPEGFEDGEPTLEPADDPYNRLVVSIINQQLSTQSAAAIKERVFDRFEITPRHMLDADPVELRDTGLSRQKIDYIKHAAERFIEDDLTREQFADMADEDVVEELTGIKGIGTWTAKMFLIFVLGREDVFPVEDLGIRQGMEALYGDMSRQEMVEKAEEWQPYRSIAALYLWKSVDG